LTEPEITAAPIQETRAWHEAYDSREQMERRRAAIPGKLRKLGVDSADRNARILDLCCGNGETLDALHAKGFHDLHGVDISISGSLAADKRFRVRQGSAAKLEFEDRSLDWILIVHSLHHLGPAENVAKVLSECHRVLKPGGRLGIVDFPNSLQIRVAFWCFRRSFWLVTGYLRYFGSLIQEEWPFLREYLREWPRVHSLLHGGIFAREQFRQELFYYYLTLRKGGTAPSEPK
jgi:ubiquinone/menaquinone biosynthesis C-methylase UbiE